MKTKLILFIAMMVMIFTMDSPGQTIINNNNILSVQPEPKQIINFNKSINLSVPAEILIPIRNDQEQKAFNYLVHLFDEKFNEKVNFRSEENEIQPHIKISLSKIIDTDEIPNDQYYRIKADLEKHEITIEYVSQTGLLYGIVTFAHFFEESDNEIRINLFEVIDYPDFTRRIMFANPGKEGINSVLDFAIRNKIESIAIPHRQYSWHKIDDEYKELFERIGKWKNKYGAPSIMQMHNIYDEKHIEISNRDDIDRLIEVIEMGVINGADKLMILADDTPPFKFGEGYILTSENDKQKFKHMADAHCYLLSELKQWFKDSALESELYYCPPFYTYEDMHYGEMELYKDTPWEADAFDPLYRDLNFLGLNIPDDVFIVWTGPYVRSRIITVKDINDWTYHLKGIVPFLADNTLYSHNPFITTPMFTAWDNNLPDDFNLRTAGNGMIINGNVDSEDSKVSFITVNDYMWNSKAYLPEASLNRAMHTLYGKNITELLLDLKEVELNLCKTIGERELWFESDNLWSIIRRIRYIHSKNPFDYHFNYTRMKGLRLQLKNSVPEPIDKKIFIEKCLTLEKRREEILEKIEIELPEVAENLKKLLVELPDFDLIN